MSYPYPLNPAEDPGAVLRRLKRQVFRDHAARDPLTIEDDDTSYRMWRIRSEREAASKGSPWHSACRSPQDVTITDTTANPGGWADGCVGTVGVRYDHSTPAGALYGITPEGEFILYAN